MSEEFGHPSIMTATAGWIFFSATAPTAGAEEKTGPSVYNCLLRTRRGTFEKQKEKKKRKKEERTWTTQAVSPSVEHLDYSYGVPWATT